MANFCTNCGASNDEGTKFCTSCGNKLPEAAPVQAPVQEPVQQPVYVQQPVQQGYPQQPVQQGYPQQPYQTGYTGFSEAPKKNSSKTIIIVIIAILLIGGAVAALFLTGVIGGGGGLNGTWVNSNGDKLVIDGTKLTGVNGKTYTLETSGNTFKVIGDSEDDVEEYLYKLDGDTLNLYDTEDTELTEPFAVFTRQGSSGGSSGEKTKSQEELLNGKWEDEYSLSSYEFNNGDVTIGALGMNFDGTYKVSGDALTITYEVMGYETTLEYTFKIDGDTLTLTDTDGVVATYYRK